MSHNNLQLVRTNDGTRDICVIFWDSMHGNDVTVVFKDNGQIMWDQGEGYSLIDMTLNPYDCMSDLIKHIEESYKDE